VHYREREIARGQASITSSLGPYSESWNATTSPSARGRHRPLPPPPDSDSSAALSRMGMQRSPRSSAQDLNVQIPDSEVDRILEIIASRIDITEEHYPNPPPYRS